MNSDYLTITLSEEIEICDNSDYASSFTAEGLSTSRYIVTCCTGCSYNVQHANSASLAGNIVSKIVDVAVDGHTVTR